jgi:hypothetical protein
LPVRTCGCRFCRKHGLLTTSDPRGEMDFILTNRTAVLRYRFDTETAEFLMCGRCGVYVGAQMEEAGRYYAIVNLRTLEGEDELGTAQPMDYSRESVSERRTRRASAGRQCALRCEVSMSDEHQRPQSAYHGADLAPARSMAEFRQRPEFVDWAPPVVRPSFREGGLSLTSVSLISVPPHSGARFVDELLTLGGAADPAQTRNSSP